MFYNIEDDSFRWIATMGKTTELMNELNKRRSKVDKYTSLAKHTIEKRESVYVEDLTTDDFTSYASDIYEKFALQSVYSTPLIIRGERIGLIQLATDKGNYISEDDRDVLKIVSSEIAAGITKLRAEENLKNAYEDLRRAHSELKELDNAKSEFLNVTSHELKTPLTAIIGYSELLSDGTLGEMEARQIRAIEGIERNTEKLTDLVRDLLDLARIESGRMSLNFMKTNLNKFFFDMESELEILVKPKDINLEFDIDKKLPSIEIDEKRINQVITNIVNNAINFSEKGSKIELRVKELEDVIEVAIKDYGEGIPESKLEKIFDRFYQVDMSDSRRSKGLGLGLSISKTIVDIHGGKIWAESEPGKGSTFFFTIPKNRK
jgi:signal transduction histidine kinase